MDEREWSIIRHDPALGVDALQAVFTTHAFARHWHDYYVIGLVGSGAQTFSYRRETYVTPPGGIILLNPGEAHTGEAALGAGGFAYRALYPTAERLAPLMAELGRADALPSFPAARVDDPGLAAQIWQLHDELRTDAAPIARESRWLGLLAALISRYGAERRAIPPVGREPRAVERARAYIEEHAADPIGLSEVAAQVGLSPFHLARSFQRTLGVPPHVYLESVRIRRAQGLIAAGMPLAEVAYAVGYSSQSHFTARFRRIIGVPPGRYRAAL